MKREDLEYLIACFRLTPKERAVVLAAMAVLALGAAVKYWRESRAPNDPAMSSTVSGPPKIEPQKSPCRN